MPTPQGIATVTLHGRFVEPDLVGTALQGQVSFTPSPTWLTFPDQDTIMAGTETATLDANGEFFIDLPCTDTAGQNPTGWTYTVSERLSGIRPRTYQILLPEVPPETIIELADITPTSVAPEYLPVVGPQGPAGADGADGVIQTVNGITGSDIVLTPTDIGAVDVDLLGVANGVATLGADGLVPTSQLPAGSGGGAVDSVNGQTGVVVLDAADVGALDLTVRGAANGVASLDASTKIPTAEMPWALADIAPGAIDSTGAVGSSSDLAREDHTHAGVALTGAQTIAGNKTFSDDLYVDDNVGVGISSSLLGRMHVKTATAAQMALVVENSNGASTTSVLDIVGDASAAVLLAGRVGTEAQAKFAVKGSGALEFGVGGSTARDVTLSRSGVGELQVTGQISASVAAPTAAGHLTRKDYVDAAIAAATGGGSVTLNTAQTITALKTFERTNLTDQAIAVRQTGDAVPRMYIRADGSLYWDSNNAWPDSFLRYFDGDQDMAPGLEVAYGFRVLGATSPADPADTVIFSVGKGDLDFPRFYIKDDGSVWWDFMGAASANLYAPNLNQLQTDVNFKANNIPGTWTAWTPTWSTTTGSSLPSWGNAVKNCYYTRVGETIFYYMEITFGSTTNFGSGAGAGDNWSFTMPYDAARLDVVAGAGSLKAGSTSNATPCMAVFATAVDRVVLYINGGKSDGAATSGGIADSVTPNAWGSGDRLYLTGHYQADSTDLP